MSTKPAVNQAVVIAFRDAAEFQAWLDAHGDLRVGVWLKIAKQGAGVPSLTAEEAVDLRPGLRLDLRPAQGLRRGLLPAEVRALPATQPLVAGQGGPGSRC
jgi:hypothetical protein